MKIIKKEIELIEFENIYEKIARAKVIIKLDCDKCITEDKIETTYCVSYEDENDCSDYSEVDEKTYNELLEHLGWGK